MEDDETVDNTWKVVKESFVSPCKEGLGLKKYHHKDWISAELLSKISVRMEKKSSYQLQRNKSREVQGIEIILFIAHKNTKKSIRADERKYIDELAEAAEQVARAGNMKGLDDNTKKLEETSKERPVKAGRQIAREEQQRKKSYSRDQIHKTNLTLFRQSKTWM